MDKNEWLEQNGFNSSEVTYCIYGDTYPYKNYFKEQGCKYSPLLKWHINKKIQVPNSCKIIEINFNKLYQWSEELQKPLQFENAAAWLQSVLIGTSAYQFLGEIGQRKYDLTVEYKSSNNFISKSGQFTYIHTFETDINKIIWFTTKELKLELNAKVLLTGTIVQHQNYKGDNTTVMNRCIIKS